MNFLLLLQFALHVVALTEDERPRLTVHADIYKPIILENLYFRTQHINRNLQLTASDNLNTNNQICSSITSSEYFKSSGFHPVDMEMIYSELESNYPHLLENTRKLNKEVDVAIPGISIRESVFVCLARNGYTKEIEEFFISQPFNVNAAFKFNNEFIAGYFVFKYSSWYEYTMVHSFAEESAKALVSPDYDVEQLYLKARKNHNRAETPKQDPICKLTDFEKMRLCASVLNSSYFKGKSEFIPGPNDKVSECQRHTVLFHADGTKAEKNARKENEEWMLPCVGERIFDSQNVVQTYYVSRAYTSNKVFMYTYDNEDEGMYLHNQSNHVSLVVDESGVNNFQSRYR